MPTPPHPQSHSQPLAQSAPAASPAAHQGAPQGKTVAIVVAAGRGSRAGGGLPKQWRDLAGQPVLAHALARLAAHPGIDRLVLVIHPDDRDRALALTGGRVTLVTGGASRDASVRAALDSLAGGDTARVLIHDAARPCLSHAVIDRVLAALEQGPAAAPGLAVVDALWRVQPQKTDTGTPDGAPPAPLHAMAAVDRSQLWRAQTPQGFWLAPLIAAHQAHPGGAADDVGVALAAGLPVTVVAGCEDNLKITYPADFAKAARLLAQDQPQTLPSHQEHAMDIRLGNGFDVHAFCAGDHVTLCGVKIAHDRGLLGHSDADVAMHALTDALYGALAEGDIGRHFPPSDPQWKGADSALFLAHAGALCREKGFAIGNVDVTIICERPKVGPHAGAMQARLAAILALAPGRVSVKATTSERLGFTGREEGIAALATATLIKPS